MFHKLFEKNLVRSGRQQGAIKKGTGKWPHAVSLRNIVQERDPLENRYVGDKLDPKKESVIGRGSGTFTGEDPSSVLLGGVYNRGGLCAGIGTNIKNVGSEKNWVRR